MLLRVVSDNTRFNYDRWKRGKSVFGESNGPDPDRFEPKRDSRPRMNASLKQNMSIRNLVFAYTLQIYH
jgi:hypothetical protein